ncbi:MAG TPA: ABC transporter ATP-binding protein [Acidimicrobiales bacterium]|nr:ABC transporter ATP-binding protein [Acidimicrobiales bacterium]
MSEIVFEGVTKRFGDVTAVDDLDLRIEHEEFMVLLGPSGCGKTTALRMVAGLDSITSGTLRIGDRVVNDVEAKHRNVSMVFQSYALYPHLTVFKNIESPLIPRDMSVEGEEHPRRLRKDERAERVRAVAETLGLGELLGRKPAALSGGQRQRVALARAIVSRPAAFLMDEPLSNLDAKLRSQTRIELSELHTRLATTFVFVTHDQVEAMTMADRLAIIDQGRLQQVGTPREVYDRPRNLFVARFIGSPPMNTIPATVRVDEGEPWADTGAGRLRLPHLDAALTDGAPVVIGVRPEDLHRDAGPVQTTVRAIEWLGPERHVLCDVAGTMVTIREPAEKRDPQPGELLAVGCEPANVHVFDAQSEERIT